MSTATPNQFLKAAIVALVLIVAFAAGLEYYWRSKGFQISYNDDKMLWSKERREVYAPPGQGTVFTGSSRIKWGLDIPTWDSLTGERAVQLALVGTSPRQVVLNLADDEKFAGKLVIEVTEGIFFALDTMRSEAFSRESLAYYKEETPAQRASAQLGFALESKLVLMEEGKLSLTSLANEMMPTNRPGVNVRVKPFYKEDTYTTERRQNMFTPFYMSDTAYQKATVQRWVNRFAAPGARPVPIPKGKGIDSLCQVYKTAIDKIRARGGSVVFVRLPSDGPQLERETLMLPRAKYWDRLLQVTGAPGIHYADYAATAGLPCVEASHLNLHNAKIYTASLVETLKNEQGWKFPANKKL